MCYQGALYSMRPAGPPTVTVPGRAAATGRGSCYKSDGFWQPHRPGLTTGLEGARQRGLHEETLTLPGRDRGGMPLDQLARTGRITKGDRSGHGGGEK